MSTGILRNRGHPPYLLHTDKKSIPFFLAIITFSTLNCKQMSTNYEQKQHTKQGEEKAEMLD